MDEFDIKQNRIQQLLDENKLDAIVLHRVSSFAWATCGAASYINIASTTGEAKLVVSKDSKYLVTGDKDLLVLKKYINTTIITPRFLWEIIKEDCRFMRIKAKRESKDI